MAKTSMINREKKRTALVKKYAVKRLALKAIIANPNASDDDRVGTRSKSYRRNPETQAQFDRCVVAH